MIAASKPVIDTQAQAAARIMGMRESLAAAEKTAPMIRPSVQDNARTATELLREENGNLRCKNLPMSSNLPQFGKGAPLEHCRFACEWHRYNSSLCLDYNHTILQNRYNFKGISLLSCFL
ncbi:MAG: hypothetical protein IJ375_02285 [Oscillospiraceae bacterium]|nr:hypothetical protein [Oscillospiraceae bacterium]